MRLRKCAGIHVEEINYIGDKIATRCKKPAVERVYGPFEPETDRQTDRETVANSRNRRVTFGEHKRASKR